MKQCLLCNLTFTPTIGSQGKFCSLSCSARYGANTRKQEQLNAYSKNPVKCKFCLTDITFNKRKSNVFCDSSCSGKFAAQKRDYTVHPTGPKKSESIIAGPFTKIYLCTCKHTKVQWYSPTVKIIHPSVNHTINLYRYQCRFKFGLQSYPDWFAYASTLINDHGWYSAANKGNNLHGCSRDHLFSVSDGFTQNIDPAIISHPANCRIILNKENQRKNKKSAITLNELLARIRDFDTKFGVP